MAKQKSEKEKASKPFTAFNQARALLKNETFQFIFGLFCVLFALFMVLAFTSFFFSGTADQSQLEPAQQEVLSQTNNEIQNYTGARGAWIAEFFINECFGVSAYFIAIFLGIAGLKLMRSYSFSLRKWGICCFTLLIWLSLFMSFVFERNLPNSGIYFGGHHGHNVCAWLQSQIGAPGIVILLLATAIFFSIYLTSSTIQFIRKLFHPKSFLPGKEEEEPSAATTPSADTVADTNSEEDARSVEIEFSINESTEKEEEKEPKEEPIPEEEDFSVTVNDTEEKEEEATEDPEFTVEVTPNEEEAQQMEPYNPKLDLSHYKYPTLDLLNKGKDESPSVNYEEQTANKNRITDVLKSFGIGISSIKATVGPTITLYEITPAPGIRISKIKNLEDDIALSLSALGIRIIAPIPGKGTIGIEVPNSVKQTVSMRTVLNSKKFQESTFDLPIAIGKTITNEVFMFDLCKMPHLLVAGATGMGKSVGLNAIITSLLYKKHPAELKFVLVDPKKVELSIYSPIEKHFLAKLPDGEDAIITDVTKVVQTLKSLCVEMDTRYDLLKKAGVRNLKEYNEKFIARQLNPNNGHKFMPYIVVIIDEFGDLIMTAGKEIELPIARIAQLARAVGIHMIIATQRPTTNIITGTIKANFPARIAFRVAAMMDSRIILDRPGANQLIGRGDMLFLQGSDPVRVQCAFVDTPEVESISAYISKQQGYPTAFYLPEYVDDNNDGGGLDSVDMDRLDPMFEDAARLIVVHQQGSTSLIQRKFAIGYNRAGRIMDQIEKAGIVGPAEGSKPRQVLCADETDLNMKLANLNLH